MSVYLGVLSVGMSLTSKLTDRYIHRKTNVHLQIDKQIYAHTEGYVDRPPDIHIDKQTDAYRQTYILTCWQENRQPKRQTKGQTSIHKDDIHRDRPTYRYTDKQT